MLLLYRSGSGPPLQVMVANIRCTEIMEDQLQSFTQDQAWQSLKAAAGKGVVPGFGQLANDLVESCITGGTDSLLHAILITCQC